jgi:glycosyltransferase involved in cell wall biosynthesis
MKPIDNLVITDGLAPPLDEGGTIMAVELIHALRGTTIVLNRASASLPLKEHVSVVHISTGNVIFTKTISYFLFAVVSLYLALTQQASATHYIPLRAPGIARHLHARLLSLLSTDFSEVLFQIPAVGAIQRKLMRFAIKVTSVADRDTLVQAGVRKVGLIPPMPKNPGKAQYNRAELRSRYGLALDDRVITHVGHVTPGRGLEFILRLAERRPHDQWLLVISSRARQGLGQLPKNVTLLSRFIEDIYEIYYLSDGYIFPLKAEGAAVSTPLSLLEAAQANIPIICSDFPNLRRTLASYEQVRFLDMSDEATALNKAAEEIERWAVVS